MHRCMCPPDVEYVLPLRWTNSAHHVSDVTELAGYLRELSLVADVTVVDGSEESLRRAHAEAFGPRVRVLQPAFGIGLNGKVAGVTTGVVAARHESVVIADDDVRYDAASLAAVLARLETADVVRPQNVFDPMPWHARWDTARSLLNRALGGDYPGTLAVRPAALGPDGYDGDVLFENLELIRTVLARGGIEVRADDILVVRRPPTARQFLRQRPRQAYDSLAQPTRMIVELAILPLAVFASRRPAVAASLVVGVLALAEYGRRRTGGRGRLPASAVLFAPAWVLERGVLAWVALVFAATGGIPYAGARLTRAATPTRKLRRRVSAPRAARGARAAS